MMPRHNEIHWEGWIYFEMFFAGIAAGAYFTAAILEMLGRGRSPLARTAHLIAFPLMAIVGLLLIVDLSRPERFWHMIVQSERGLPMFKWWSPMSLGSWLILLFSGVTFVSFVDALIDRGTFSLGGWRRDGATLHGHRWGLVWSLIGAMLGVFVAGYSGVLLSATEMPGWRDSTLISALYVATAAATGMAAMLLVQALRGRRWLADAADLVRVNVMVIVWQLLLLLVFVMTLGGAASVFLTGLPLFGLVAAGVLGGVAPLLMLRFGSARVAPATAALAAALILAGGFLLRFAVVMGPQRG
jgi:formate-dependent nitrite reductase membrane component NrfD